MENKKITEKILFCLGILLLFIGLWNFIDFDFINKYTLLGLVVVSAVATYFTASKDLFKSKTISNVFSIIALGLTTTSIYMAEYVFNLNSFGWLASILVGIAFIFYIHEFNIRIVYYIGSLFYLIAIGVTTGYNIGTSSLVNILGFGFAEYMLSKYGNRNPKDLVLQVIVSSTAVISSILWLSNLLDKIPIFNPNCLLSIILIVVYGYVVYFSGLELNKGISGTLKTTLTIFVLQTTVLEFWEQGFSTIPIPIILTILCTLASIFWHLRGLMDGRKISILVLVLQFIVISTNVLRFTTFAVFAMILGAFLILVAILVNKNKIAKKKFN